ncbi:MAG: acyl-ACP--UDP-N-acetylglucosamine O-acyltransferase [Gammaproteobacteria bacterium]|nr:acyl-ACP--UDP-N-acetylglucosamine O-acyltransferase [Gammaproteobacteria bacterium]
MLHCESAVHLPEPELIDPQANIAPNAQLAPGVSVGPFSVIGDEVEIGANTVIGSHVVIRPGTVIGPGNRIFSFSSIGDDPQHAAYAGEQTRLLIGAGNTVREFCTLNRGTPEGGGVTRIGDRNILMAYVHVAHDCSIGDNCVLVNGAGLAGHVTVEDHAIISGFTLVHQFCRIGAHSMTGAGAICLYDVPPFVMVAAVTGNTPTLHGINKRGLRRRHFSTASIAALGRAYRVIFRSGIELHNALEQLGDLREEHAEVRHLADFMQSSVRGVLR